MTFHLFLEQEKFSMISLNSLFLFFYFSINLYVKVRIEQKLIDPKRKQKPNFDGIDITDIFKTIKKEFTHYTPQQKDLDFLLSKGKQKEIEYINKLLNLRNTVNSSYSWIATLIIIINFIVWNSI